MAVSVYALVADDSAAIDAGSVSIDHRERIPQQPIVAPAVRLNSHRQAAFA